MAADSGSIKVEIAESSNSGEGEKAKATLSTGQKRIKEIEPPICIDAAICKPRSKSAKLLSSANAAGVRPYLNQDYYKLKEECFKTGKLFEDPHFKCDSSSLPSKHAGKVRISWKRPHEIDPDPHFAAKSLSRLDIDQGNLGDCWFLASIAALSMQPHLFKRVVPLDNSFRKENKYCGIFHFRFWQYGEWVDVVVDDRLPVIHGKPAFMRSMQKNVFWSALLEKAYAKLCNGYEALSGGHEDEGMEDLTGGIAYTVKLRKDQQPLEDVPADLYEQMHKAIRRSSLLGSLIGHVPKVEQEEGGEQKLGNGLVAGHAYTITAVRYVHLTLPNGEKNKEKLVRIRNPWGHRKPTEWRGDWGDKSELWNYVREEERKTFLKDEEDGEFWMSYNDFKVNFDGVTICYLGPEALTDNEADTRESWRQVIIRDRWEKNVNAGGQHGHPTYWTNPQYVLRVPESTRTESTDSESASNSATKTPNVVIGLMQIGRKALKAYQAIDYLAVFTAVYNKVDGQRVRVAPERTRYVKARETIVQAYLPPGDYILVASTIKPQQEGDFMLRVYAEGKIDASREEPEEETAVTKPEEKVKIDEDAFELSPEEKLKIEEHSKRSAAVDEAVKKVDELKEKRDQIMEVIFQQYARKEGSEDDEVESIDAWVLQKLLNHVGKRKISFKFDGYSIELCRSLIALVDVDRNGRIVKHQFTKLYKRLSSLKDSFVKSDESKLGKLTTSQLREALRRTGCTISKPVLYTIVKRYSDPEGFIHFEDFILGTARLQTAIETFGGLSKADDNNALLAQDQFVQLLLYC